MNIAKLFSRFTRRSLTAPPSTTADHAAVAPKREFSRIVISPASGSEDGVRHGDYTVAREEVIAVADLPSYTRTIQTTHLRAEFRESICPIQLTTEGDDRRTFAIVLTRSVVGTDVIDEIYAELQKTYRPATPAVYVATQTVVSELARSESSNDLARKLAADRESPFFKMFVEITDFAIENGVSDLHLKLKKEKEYSQVGFRMDGSIFRPRKFRMPSDQLRRMLGFMYSFKGNSTSTSYYSAEESLQCQIEETIGGQRLGFRWSQFPTHKGLKVVLRVMKLDAGDAYTSLGMQPNGAGLPPYQEKAILRALRTDGGGWVISGRVNSGKSKLLQTVLNMLPSHFEINTAEDPIEYLLTHEGANQHSTSRGIGDNDGKDAFEPFKLQNKRTDPDATAIMELRDTSTTGAFRDAVLAGQRGFTTLHAPDALAIPGRLMSEEFGLTRDVVTMPDFLKMLIHLALVPKNCPECSLLAVSEETNTYLKNVLSMPGVDSAVAEIAAASLRIASSPFLHNLQRLFAIDLSNIRVRNPNGCAHCMREGVPELNGIRGRSLVAQMIEPTDDMMVLVRASKNIELRHYYRGLRAAGYDSDNSDGKSPLEIAMYKVSRGELCLSEAEKRFQTIEAYEHGLKRLTLGNGRTSIRLPDPSIARSVRRSRLASPPGYSRRNYGNGRLTNAQSES